MSNDIFRYTINFTLKITSVSPLVFTMFASRTYILPWAINIGPPRFRRFLVNALPWRNLHKARDTVDFMYATSMDIFNEKKRALQDGDTTLSHEVSEGKDIISILSTLTSMLRNSSQLTRRDSARKYEGLHGRPVE